jgi:hypothetical protein
VSDQGEPSRRGGIEGEEHQVQGSRKDPVDRVLPVIGAREPEIVRVGLEPGHPASGVDQEDPQRDLEVRMRGHRRGTRRIARGDRLQ